MAGTTLVGGATWPKWRARRSLTRRDLNTMRRAASFVVTPVIVLPFLVAIAAMAGVASVALAVSPLISARVASTGCPNVIFVGARGSGEPIARSTHGLGDAVNIMASAMNAALGAHDLTMRTFADPYPADPVSDLYPSKDEAITMATALAPLADAAWAAHVHKYFRSIDTGVADAVAAAEHDVAQCPRAALVMAGYSQGAMVMHQAELKLAASHESNVLNHIAGTLLLGDGDRVRNSKATLFGTSKGGAGIQTFLDGLAHVSTHDVESPATTANICDEDDIVCDFDPKRLLRGLNPLAIVAAFKHAGYVHTHYATSESKPLHEAAEWLAAKIMEADSPAPLYASVSVATLCSNGGVKSDAVNGCPYVGTSQIGDSVFEHAILIEDNDESVLPSYWNLIDFPATTCRSIRLAFGMPTDGSQPGDTASVRVTAQTLAPQSAAVGYGQVAELDATLDGHPWSLENAATSTADKIAINGVASCSTSSGY